MKYGIVLEDLFAVHAPPSGHPERPDRIRSLVEAIDLWERPAGLKRESPVAAEERWIRGVHTKAHLERIRSTAGQSVTRLDADTYTSRDSFRIALLAVGGVIRLLDQLLEGLIDGGFALVRPPGHHAETDKAMGFCLFNNVAIAAQYALQARGLQRVAIVDFDVHHGNGTQEIFYSRSDVLYVSQHQSPFYPGTGHFRESGTGSGKGYTVNFPLPAGTGNHVYCSVFHDFVIPILNLYRPDLILASAGYDAHRQDPLGGMNMDENGFGELVNLLNGAAREVCQGRILYVLEGGYDLEALSRSVLCSIATTLEPRKFTIEESQVSEYTAYGQHMKVHFSRWWKL